MLLIQKEQNELAKTKAIVQAIVNPKEAQETWQAYFKSSFPWVEFAQDREKQDVIAKLMEEVKRGPINVNAPPDTAKFRSRIKAKIIQRKEETVEVSSRKPVALRPIIPIGPHAKR